MPTYKHLTLNERISIEHYLKKSYSFKAISRELNRDCTTISKEIKHHITKKRSGAYGKAFNNCIYRLNCNQSYLCDDSSCNRYRCRSCHKCLDICPQYSKESCKLLLNPPYVCNGCTKLSSCTLEKSFYYAVTAQKEYEYFRSESRSGINISEEEISRLDQFISPLIRKGQSIHHICSNNRDTIMHSEKAIYNYISYNLFSARNIDLPRKVSYRPRRKIPNYFKVDKACRIGRTYDDFLAFMHQHPDSPVVQIDSVEGIKGGKVLLTIHFTHSLFMLAFIRDANTSQSVIDLFNNLESELSSEIFSTLFPVILTDNGSEFSNPLAIEFDKHGNQRTRIFYCDPSAPYQKGAAENNHEFIRRIIPKGKSFDHYTQDDISLMMNHINSYGRKKLNNQSPISVFSFLHKNDILKKLGVNIIPSNDIILSPKLLKR